MWRYPPTTSSAIQGFATSNSRPFNINVIGRDFGDWNSSEGARAFV